MAATDPRLKRRGTKNGVEIWTARVDLPLDSDGKRRRHRWTFSGSKTAAAKAFRERLAEIDQGQFLKPSKETFGQFIRAWLDRSRGQYSPKTWERFDSIIRLHVIPKLGDVPLQRLSSSHLNQAYSSWRAGGLSGQTVRHHHRLIHRALAEAARAGVVRSNVASSAIRPKVERREMRCLTDAEIRRIVRIARGSQFELFVTLALATGARRGELVGLRWGDVDFGRSTIAIRRSIEQTGAGLRVKAPKNGRARVVQLPQIALTALERYRIDDVDDAATYILRGDGPECWIPQRVSDGFREILRKAKVQGASVHTLRHTAATLLLARDVHPKVVSEMLGHSSVTITLDLYSHSLPSLQEAAALRLDESLALLFDVLADAK